MAIWPCHRTSSKPFSITAAGRAGLAGVSNLAAFDAEFAAEAKRNEFARRLTSIPGIGALNATALVVALGDAQTFARGRDLAVWLGLVPRQQTASTWRHQTWQQILAQDADPRRSRSVADAEPRQYPAWSMAAWSPRESPFEYGCRCPCRQGGAHCLGILALPHHFRTASNCCLISQSLSASTMSAGG
jgi:hypothetical protein